MSAFAKSILTDAGWDTLASALAGGKLVFVRMEAGDGTVADDAEMEGMTALKNKVMDIPITSYSDDGKGQLTLIGTLSSKNVTTAFYFRELGVIATVGGGPETLYCVANSYDLADYIPDSSNPAVVIQNVEIIVKIDKDVDVTVVLGLGANVTAENIGPATVGAGWFRDKQNNILFFKRFITTSSLRITESADTVQADVIFPQGVPTGCIMEYPSMISPVGWRNCDGSELSRTGFPELYALLGTKFGAGNGIDTYNLPDFRGKSAVGAGLGIGLTARSIGDIGGVENVTLTIAQIPSHTHTASQPAHIHSVHDPTHAHSIADGGHSHGLGDPGHTHDTFYEQHYGGNAVGGPGTYNWTAAWTSSKGAGTGIWCGGSGVGIGIYGAGTGISLYAAGNDPITVSSTGGSQSHTNMHPFLVVNKIIKL